MPAGGDDGNDVEMLGRVGLGVAIGDAETNPAKEAVVLELLL